ncbi:PASTA domain-containing protein [Solirubrobacter phytolaccae]|uniref:PASTA domain-containing protein n=1 Tax=Solirubrobacter phytolaccae TaxID=1404360 RepID=A0A9X3NAP0_9ACTN|nr:PASTA domain-containing protein [Solirubrobacter phytolaccae]MDA0182968.1 PASTA domain-containing protein [Solirubrobacter phytolaccae]
MRSLALILTAGLLVSACGEAPKPAANARVTLKLSLPDDGGMVRDERVVVRGTVSPADASVRVGGEDAEVDGGEFSKEVALAPGGNVIDISASSPGRRPATDAVRVTRDMRVDVPNVVGQEVDPAKTAVGNVGLKVEEEQRGGWLDRVIPGTDHVCATRPAAGTPVDKGTTVTLVTQRECPTGP